MFSPAPVTDALSMGAAASMGALQGIAEFLPISSSGHLAIAARMFDIDPSQGGHTLSVVLHAGTLMAVLVHYRRQLWDLVREFFGPEPTRARNMVLALFVATLPLAFALLDPVKQAIMRVEGEIRWVGIALLFTAAALAFSHRRVTPKDDPELAPSIGVAALIGIAQFIAITPGISRSGMTIAAALALGLGRARAAQFSFLLSIPAILGASLDEVLKLSEQGAAQVSGGALALGFGVSFAVGLTCLGALIAVLERVGLMPFVPYLIAVGIAAIALA